MSDREPLRDILAELGAPVGDDPLGAVDDLLRREPERRGELTDRLVQALARTADSRLAARLMVALGACHLVKDPARSRETLVEALGLLDPADGRAHARGGLRLATAELNLGNAKAARGHLARALTGVVALDEEPPLVELAHDLRAAGDVLAADLVEHLRRERREAKGGDRDRLEVLGRLVHALKSGAAGTAEPIYAILRAILDETGAERGFVMLYDDATLRFELGLSRQGRVLGQGDFGFSTTIVEKALEKQGAVLVPDISAVLPFAMATSARELGLQSALCAPLRVGRRRPGAAASLDALPNVKGIAGVLYVDAQATGTFGDEDARFFEILADCAVLALRARSSGAPAAPAAEDKRVVARPTAKIAAEPAEPPPQGYDEFVTKDGAMRSMIRLIDRVAPSDANVLVRGESGTGKELVARALHKHSRKAAGPFVAVDCGAIPENLVQSELFGNEKHAYTGADQARPGLFERAHGGTLFLDEVGEMSPVMQSALLRVMQEGEVRRLGGDRVRSVDVRIVAATHRDLKAMVERGDFRHDLLFRIAVVEIKIPPLRERKGDLSILADAIIAKIAQRNGTPPVAIEPGSLGRLEEHGWPGNVRELENVLASATVMSRGVITRAEIDHVLGRSSRGDHAALQKSASHPAIPSLTLDGTIEEIEKRAIQERLERFQWNQVHTAKSLGMDRNTLHRKILRYGIMRT